MTDSGNGFLLIVRNLYDSDQFIIEKGDRFILQSRVELRAQGQPGKKVVDEK
jgi:hypothetical protein